MSKYLNDHPGGVEIVTDLAGQDATVDYDDVGHTEEAHKVLEKFYVGDLVAGGAATAPDTKAAVPIAAAPVTPLKEAPKAVVAPVASKYEAPKPTGKPQFKEDDNSSTMMIGVAVAVAAAGFFLYRKMGKQ